MLTGLKERPEKPCDSLLVASPAEFASCRKKGHVTAGSGACRACAREGKNPKTGGRPCGGYINTGYAPFACKNCDHSYDQHN